MTREEEHEAFVKARNYQESFPWFRGVSRGSPFYERVEGQEQAGAVSGPSPANPCAELDLLLGLTGGNHRNHCCVGMALNLGAGCQRRSWYAERALYLHRRFCEIVGIRRMSGGDTHAVVDWNNDPERTKAEVLAALDKCIAATAPEPDLEDALPAGLGDLGGQTAIEEHLVGDVRG